MSSLSPSDSQPRRVGLTTRQTTSTSSISLTSSTSSPPVSTSSSSSSSPSIVPSLTASIISSTPTTSSELTSSTESASSSWSPSTVTTVIVDSTSFPLPTIDTSPTSFSFQNEVGYGFVFAIVGVVGFVVIIFIATLFLKHKNNKRLMQEASFLDLGHGSHAKRLPTKDNSLPPLHYHPPMDNHRSPPPSRHYNSPPPTYNHRSPPPLHYHATPPPPTYHHSLPPSRHRSSPPASYTPKVAAQLYASSERYSSPPLPPLPMQKQASHLRHHLSYVSTMSNEVKYSRPVLEEMRGSVIGGQRPDGTIQVGRQYDTP